MTREEYLRAFGAAMREAREDTGLLQQDLARRVGLSRVSITNIEAGRQGVGVDLAARLVTEIGMRVPGWPEQDTAALRQQNARLIGIVEHVRAAVRKDAW